MNLKSQLLESVKMGAFAFWQRWNKELEKWRQWCYEGKAVALFGAAAMGERCCTYLDQLNIPVNAVLDNNKEKTGIFHTLSGEIRCCLPEELDVEPENVLCILTTGAQYIEELQDQLHRIGIENTFSNGHIDFFLETLSMMNEKGIEAYIDALDELFDYYEDEESFKVLWMHFKQLFEINVVPKGCEKISFENLCTTPQYFLNNGAYLGHQETMLDCGAFIGDTVEDLVSNIEFDEFEEYCCFEMDQTNYLKLLDTVSGFRDDVRKKITCYNFGVGAKKQKFSYVFHEGRSVMTNNGEHTAESVRIDDLCADKKVTFIKMDIEGSEPLALKGARQVIVNNRPMSAICVYHNLKDFWTIPHLLREFVPQYKFKLVHHSSGWDDSVCYAKCGEW